MPGRRAYRRMQSQPTLSQQFRALFRPGDSWFDADNVVLDGGGTKVVSLVDYLDSSHFMTQATSAAQCAAPAADAALSGAKSLAFAGAQVYASTRAASAWKFMHDGTGMFVLSVHVPQAAGRIWSTHGATTQAGASCSVSSATQHSGRVGNGSAVIIGPTVVTSWTAVGESTAFSGTLNGDTTYTWALQRNGVQLAGNTQSLAFSSGSPAQTLGLGGEAVGASYFTGRIAMLVAMKRVPSASEMAVIRSYVRAKYGVAA